MNLSQRAARLFAWLRAAPAAAWLAWLRALRAALPVLLLCLPLPLILADGVAQAAWVRENELISAMLVWGLVFGWLLALSRWPGWAAALYCLLLSTAMSALALGDVLPALSDLGAGYAVVVDGMRLRMVALGLRAGGWTATLAAGGAVRDTGLFIFFLALAGWWASAWLLWWLLRRKRALVGILPLTLLMAINAHLSHQKRLPLLVFLLFAFLLVARSAFLQVIQDWQRRRVDYSDELGPEWGVGASLAAAGVATFALLFSLVGTPQGMRLLADMVERSRRGMSDTANQLFGGVNPPPTAESPASSIPDVNTPNLSRIGSPLPRGSAVVMWVGLSDPAPLPDDVNGPVYQQIAVPRHYWRSQVFSTYTGRGWEIAELLPDAVANVAEPSVPVGRYLLEQRYEIEARHSGVLFSVSEPVNADGATLLRRVAPDRSVLVEGRSSQYTVSSLATAVTVRQMDEAGSNYGEEIRAVYLQLPENLPDRVRTLAEEITVAADTPYRKAEKIQEFLRVSYAYQEDAPLAPEGRDVVDHFLFDASGGFCSHYASAMTVMLRAVGVPARVAAGYAMGSYDRRRGMYRVPVSSAHAWVEVYFPGFGWVEFEPTPAYNTFAYAQGAGGSNALPQDRLPEPLPEEAAAPSQLLWLLVPLGLTAGLWGLYGWTRWEKRRLEMPGKAADKLYARVRRGLEQAGLPPALSLTPVEFAQEVLPELEIYPRVAEALRRATTVFIQSAYSPRDPAIDDVLLGEAAWSDARNERLRLWWKLRVG